MSSTEHARRNQLFSLGIRLAIGGALLMFLFTRHADLQQVWKLISQSDFRRLFFAVFIAVTGEVITAFKWKLLVRYIGGHLPMLHAIRASFVGMFYNNFFPGSVGGDIARVLLISRQAGGRAKATASAFMQRNSGLAGLFAIGLPASFLWPRELRWPGHQDFSGIAGWLNDCRTWLIGAAAGYAAVNCIMFSQTVYRRMWRLVRFEDDHPHTSRWHQGLKKILHKIQRFHVELHGYDFWMAAPLAISAATQLMDVYMVYNLAQALGLPVPFYVFIVAVPMVSLANLAPVTINGIGLRETMYVTLLCGAGLSASEAVALSLLQFAMISLMAGIGGVVQIVGRISIFGAEPGR